MNYLRILLFLISVSTTKFLLACDNEIDNESKTGIKGNTTSIPNACKNPCRYTSVYFKHSLSKTGVKLQISETIKINNKFLFLKSV